MMPEACAMIRQCARLSAKAAQGSAASPSQMGRFEAQWLAADKNLLALADLSGQWIDRVRREASCSHGFERQPDSRRTGDERLERPLRMHLLSSPLRVQP